MKAFVMEKVLYRKAVTRKERIYCKVMVRESQGGHCKLLHG